ncbi:hypothetical protein B0H19DRAFT_1079373 [Mycena capillaripes]|nr:hypothetical protein B0H19DRAFT_1079373 [Mycena capillaripes]
MSSTRVKPGPPKLRSSSAKWLKNTGRRDVAEMQSDGESAKIRLGPENRVHLFVVGKTIPAIHLLQDEQSETSELCNPVPPKLEIISPEIGGAMQFISCERDVPWADTDQ